MLTVAPEIHRPPPPYIQIADHFRALIHDGTLPEGARLPSLADIRQDFRVANATAARALAQLQVEGLVYSSPRGTWVAGPDGSAIKASSPQTRILRARHGGTTEASGETHEVTAAEMITAPIYVSELLGLDEDPARVIRREWITSEHGAPRALTVTWYPAALAAEVPELLADRAGDVGPMLRRIEDTTGPAASGRDYLHARTADRREAGALGIPPGTAILAGTWLLWTADGALIEYGEYVLPPRHTLSYPYEIPAAETD